MCVHEVLLDMFLSRVGEVVVHFMAVPLPGPQDDGGEGMLIDSVGKGLRLQADARVLVVDCTALPLDPLQEVARVKLHSRRCGQHLEAPP